MYNLEDYDGLVDLVANPQKQVRYQHPFMGENIHL
jgi:hypothetical protein